MVIETSVVASSSAPATPTAKPDSAASKSSPPAAKTTTRRSLPTQGGGDADANSTDNDLSKEEVLDVSNRSTGEDSTCSSGSSGSAVEQKSGPKGEDEVSSRSLTIQGKRWVNPQFIAWPLGAVFHGASFKQLQKDDFLLFLPPPPYSSVGA